MHKMIMAVIPQDEARQVIDALVIAGHTSTFATGRGGVLRQAQQMLFIAVSESNLPKVLDIIRDNCHTRVRIEMAGGNEQAPSPQEEEAGSAEVGGAVIFVWDLSHFEVV